MRIDTEQRLQRAIDLFNEAEERIKELNAQNISRWNVAMKMKRAEELKMKIWLKGKCNELMEQLAVQEIKLIDII